MPSDTSKPVGLLYDRTNPNFGDLAVGLALKQVLTRNGIRWIDLPNRIDPPDLGLLSTVIVGGGQLLRRKGSFFYEGFRLPGRNILNTCGTTPDVGDLEFLRKYRYVSVRSTMDLQRVEMYRPDAVVAPCSSLALTVPHTKTPQFPGKEVVLIHLFRRVTSNLEGLARLLDAALKGLDKVLVSITPYCRDYECLRDLSTLTGWPLLQGLSPEETVALIESPRVAGVVSASLHASMFSHREGKPFLVYPIDPKMNAFLSERGLDARTWTPDLSAAEMNRRLFLDQQAITASWLNDYRALSSHLERLLIECRNAMAEG